MAKVQKIIEKRQQGERYGLFGASGSGKTTKARELIRNTNRIVVFDSVKQEWTQNCKSWLGRNAIVVLRIEDLRREIYRNWQKGFKIVFCPEFSKEVRQLDAVCNLIWQVQFGFGVAHNAKITLLVDEAQEAAPAGLKQVQSNHGALRMATMGRGKGVNFIVCSQRLKSVDINIRSNLTGLFLFRLSDLSDIQEAKRLLLGKGDAGEIANFDYYYKDENGIINFFKKK